MNPTDKLELQVAEEQDGGAVVQLPENEPSPQQSEPAEMAQGGEAQDDDDANDMSDVSADDPDREAIRAARREERKLKKQIHREKARESNHLINALKKQNQQLAERLANLETRTSGAELARVDKIIEDTGVQIEYAKMKMREAVSSQDGDAVVKAQELLFESQRKLESLKNIKENAAKQMSQPKQNIQMPDPMVQRMAADWMSKNEWYDPQGKDLDSEFAQRIDKKLTEEGFDPSSSDYWEELDDRLSKYLPHRYSQQQEKPRMTRPRSIVSGSGREVSPAGRSNEFRLSPERVAVMKEAGVWDDPARRAAMIKKYAEYDRQLKKG